MEIIIDRNKKRKYLMMDSSDNDMLGIKQIQKNHQKEIEIDPMSTNPIDVHLCRNTLKSILGKKVWAMKRDSDTMLIGYIVDVYPQRVLLVKVNDENVPLEFECCVAIGD